MSGSKRPEAGRSTGTGSMNKLSEEGLSELFQGCRTYRRYEQKDIPQSLIHEIIEDARTASCGSNRQRLRYLAVLSTQLCAKLADHVHYAALLPKEAGEPKEHEKAKAFLVILSPKNAGRIADIDTGIAADRIVLSAYARGIGSCMMLNFDNAECRKLLNIPEDMEIRLIISMGCPAHTSVIETAGSEDDLAYWMDENRDYHVPKLKTEQILKII